jgi:capsule polysaccharide export protein KpsE/RkpR
MAKHEDMSTLETLSELLADLSNYEDKFCEFALENESAVKVALYAKSIQDNLAVPNDLKLFISECQKSIELFKSYLESIEDEEEDGE